MTKNNFMVAKLKIPFIMEGHFRIKKRPASFRGKLALTRPCVALYKAILPFYWAKLHIGFLLQKYKDI